MSDDAQCAGGTERETVRYGVPLATAYQLAESMETVGPDRDFTIERAFCILADLHGDFPDPWMVTPNMAICECPECGSSHIGQCEDDQHCNQCLAVWPYNEPEKTHFPGPNVGGESA